MRQMSYNEFLTLNGIGVFLSLGSGFIAGGNWIFVGLLGMYFVPIPVILFYRAIRNLTGDEIAPVKITFSPSIGLHQKEN